MESSSKGIVIGHREAAAALAFCGDSAEHAQVVFKVTAREVKAGATSRVANVVYTGKNYGCDSGEWPIAASFMRLIRGATQEGSANVPTSLARLLIERNVIKRVEIFWKESGEVAKYIEDPNPIAPNLQMKFSQIADIIEFDEEKKGSWFGIDQRRFRLVNSVSMAVGNKVPISYFPGGKLAPLGFLVKGDGGEWRGVLITVETLGPGKAAKDVADMGGNEPEADPPAPDPAEEESDAAKANPPGAPVRLVPSPPLANAKKSKAKKK